MPVKWWNDFSRGMNTDIIDPGPGWARYIKDGVIVGNEVRQRGHRTSVDLGTISDTFSSIGAVWGADNSGNDDQIVACVLASAGASLLAGYISNLMYRLGGRVDGDNAAYSGGAVVRTYGTPAEIGDEGLIPFMTTFGIPDTTAAPVKFNDADGAVNRAVGALSSAYRTGTITVTRNSRVIEGAGVNWSGNVVVGDYLYIQDTSTTPALNSRLFRITAITDSDTLEVDVAPTWDEAAITSIATVKYSAHCIGRLSSPSNVFSDGSSSVNWVSAGVLGSYRDRVLAGNVRVYDGGRHRLIYDGLMWSGAPDESSYFFEGADLWNAANIVRVGVGHGYKINAIHEFNGQALIIKDRGAFVLSGDLLTGDVVQPAQIDLISAKSGTLWGYSTCVTPVGVLWHDLRQQALWLWQGGGQLVNIASNRFTQYLRNNIGHPMRLSCGDGRVYMFPATGTTMIVWDYIKDVFYLADMPSSGYGGNVFHSLAVENQTDLVFRLGTDCLAHNLLHDINNLDSSGTIQDGGNTSAPVLDVQTPSFVPEGSIRPTAVRAVYHMDANSGTPQLQPYIQEETQAAGTNAGSVLPSTTDASRARSGISTGHTAYGPVSVGVYENANDDSGDIRIYALGLEYEVDEDT